MSRAREDYRWLALNRTSMTTLSKLTFTKNYCLNTWWQTSILLSAATRKLQEVEKIRPPTTNFREFFIKFIEAFNLFTSLSFSLSKCNYFEGSFELPMSIEFVLIQCKAMYSETSRKNSRTVYSNAHAVIRKSHETKKTIDTFKTLYPADHPLSVLMIGIDSISRSNLIRAMPNTAQYLYDTGWFELKGYNKVSLVLNVS